MERFAFRPMALIFETVIGLMMVSIAIPYSIFAAQPNSKKVLPIPPKDLSAIADSAAKEYAKMKTFRSLMKLESRALSKAEFQFLQEKLGPVESLELPEIKTSGTAITILDGEVPAGIRMIDPSAGKIEINNTQITLSDDFIKNWHVIEETLPKSHAQNHFTFLINNAEANPLIIVAVIAALVALYQWAHHWAVSRDVASGLEFCNLTIENLNKMKTSEPSGGYQYSSGHQHEMNELFNQALQITGPIVQNMEQCSGLVFSCGKRGELKQCLQDLQKVYATMVPPGSYNDPGASGTAGSTSP